MIEVLIAVQQFAVRLSFGEYCPGSGHDYVIGCFNPVELCFVGLYQGLGLVRFDPLESTGTRARDAPRGT